MANRYGNDERPSSYRHPSQNPDYYAMGGSQYHVAPSFFGAFDAESSFNQLQQQTLNPILDDVDSFTKIAVRLITEKDQSNQSGETILQRMLTAEERYLFSDAYKLKKCSLPTFPSPGESAHDMLIRRLANDFGDSLLKKQLDNPSGRQSHLQNPVWNSQPVRPEYDVSTQQLQNHGFNVYKQQETPPQRHFQRILTNQSNLSSLQLSQQQRQENNDEQEAGSPDRNMGLSHRGSCDTSQDRGSIQHSARSRQKRKSKSPVRRIRSHSPSLREIERPKPPTPILKKGLHNNHSAHESVTKVVVQAPKSPIRGGEGKMIEMRPCMPIRSDSRMISHALLAESKTRQRLMEEIDRTFTLALQSTNQGDRAKYRDHLEGLKNQLETLTSASFVSSLPMNDVGRRNTTRATMKPTLPPQEKYYEIDAILFNESQKPSQAHHGPLSGHLQRPFSSIMEMEDFGASSHNPIVAQQRSMRSLSKQVTEQRDDWPMVDKSDNNEVPNSINIDYKLMDVESVFTQWSEERSITALQAVEKPKGALVNSEHDRTIGRQNLAMDAKKSGQPESMKVLSPGNLPENFEFEAEVEGRSFTARVPKGGAKKGEVFESTIKDWRTTTYQEKAIPRLKWKDGLCDCFRYGLDHPTLWNSFLFPQSKSWRRACFILKLLVSSHFHSSWTHTSHGTNAPVGSG